MKIYTKTGDQGFTRLVGGTKVKKNHPRIDAYGTLDELNSFIGLLASSTPEVITLELQKIQNELFNLGSLWACEKPEISLPRLPTDATSFLESRMDFFSETLPPLREFILPGGTPASAYSHICRTLTRRVERLIVTLMEEEAIDPEHLIYLNRLSDYFFVLARHLNHLENKKDIPWKK